MSTVYANVKESEIYLGQSSEISKRVSMEDVQQFANVTGDKNPMHVDEEYASKTQFKTRIAHGMLGASLISAVLGMNLPGPGTVYLGQELKFVHPIHFDDVITAKATVKEIIPKKNFSLVKLDTNVINQAGEVVIEGTATVIPPK